MAKSRKAQKHTESVKQAARIPKRFGQKICIENTCGIFPDDFQEHVKSAMAHGWTDADKLGQVSCDTMRTSGVTHPQELDQLVPGNNVAQHVLRAAFFFGAMQKILPNSARTSNNAMALSGVRLSAMGQKDLTLSFLRMPDNVRRSVIRTGRPAGFSQIKPLGWRSYCVGAMAVARTAYALDTLGVKMGHACTKLDTAAKIDLFVGPFDAGRGLALQVKAVSGSDTTWEVVRSGAVVYGISAKSNRTRIGLYKGVRYFNSSQNADCTAAILHVGMTEGLIHDLHSKELYDSLTLLIEQEITNKTRRL
ncbi:MAG: hypothetical protein Q8P30_01090 [Candidatus Uhrbacteria bacterium]|nr:hypothetical protein [Candidatus Uhrbacteria bacterium]